MKNIHCSSITAPRPVTKDLEARTQERISAIQAATELDDLIALVGVWDADRREIDTWISLVRLRFQQDTRDAEAKQNSDWCDQSEPRLTEADVAVMRALLAHPLRPELEQHFGKQAFALWHVQTLSFAPEIVDDLVAEKTLVAEYTALLASAEFEFEGEKHNFSTLAQFRQAPERERRYASERIGWDWCSEHADELDTIYDQLVALRHGMATKLGRKDFVELGYERMSRIDYDRSDVERFRAEIRELVVPLCAELAARQARDLGLHGLKLWDERLLDRAGNPRPQGDHDWMLERAQELFDGVGHGLGDFFRLMNEGEYLDLRSRKGKAGGGFCTTFATVGMPFVYANFNGTKSDVEVFTHEIGHAFQCWSSRDVEIFDYRWPTMESCEIHSMSLEFLTLPWMDRFFGDDAKRFRRTHVTESLMFLPYGTAVDEFQHRVYDRPEMTPAERRATWLELERTYLPWRDNGDIEHPSSGGLWQLQRHVYNAPFYYIDYVLAQTCALQFWEFAERDRTAAMKSYVALCRRGGRAPFQELVRGAGLVSPFEPGCLRNAVSCAARELEITVA